MNPVRTIVVDDGDYLFIVVRRSENTYDVSDPAGSIGGTGRAYRVIGDITPYVEIIPIQPARTHDQFTQKRIEANNRG